MGYLLLKNRNLFVCVGLVILLQYLVERLLCLLSVVEVSSSNSAYCVQ